MYLRKLSSFFAYYKAYYEYIKQSYNSDSYIKIKPKYKGHIKKHKRIENTLRIRLHNALLTLNFLNTTEKKTNAAVRH